MSEIISNLEKASMYIAASSHSQFRSAMRASAGRATKRDTATGKNNLDNKLLVDCLVLPF